MTHKLSIIILNYNTKDLLVNCLSSLVRVKKEVSFEVIIADNGSIDDSIPMVKGRFPWVKVVENKANLGFAAGNNRARKVVTGDYVLFLNSDTEMNEATLKETMRYMDENKDVGAMTCKLLLPNGGLDRDARRSFPTPWVAFTHFSFLDRIFSKSMLFSKYWYGFISPDVEHEVDVIEGAFFLVRKDVLDSVDWFDEDYFLDAEDIDLSWKIKEKGWKIIYYPKVSIVHIKKATKKKVSGRFIGRGVEAMEIFYRKRLWSRYPFLINILVIIGIRVVKILRFATSRL